MYAYIRGLIKARLADGLIIENGGIGYRIFASPGLVARFPAGSNETTVYTSLYLREDVMALYGFPSEDELRLFELLLQVSGIGPKVATQIVGQMRPDEFALAIITGDTKALMQIRGIGRKGAERMILELKDKLKSEQLPVSDSTVPPDSGNTLRSEAMSALMVLGYSSTEASQAVTAVAGQTEHLEDLVRLALRQLMR